jgi:hypothetical protein
LIFAPTRPFLAMIRPLVIVMVQLTAVCHPYCTPSPLRRSSLAGLPDPSVSEYARFPRRDDTGGIIRALSTHSRTLLVRRPRYTTQILHLLLL